MICSCPVCNRRIAASLPLFGTVQKCLGCGAKIRIPGEDGGLAELVEKWLEGERRPEEEVKPPPPDAGPSAWSPMVAATGAGPVMALPNVPTSAVTSPPPVPAEYRRPSPVDPLPPAAPARTAPPEPSKAQAPRPPVTTISSTTAELPARNETEAITRPVLGLHPLKRNLAALAGGVVLVGVVISIVLVRTALSKRSGPDPAQAAALKFNDALAQADSGAHGSCAAFVRSVERWLDGQALEPAAIRKSLESAIRDAEEYSAKVGAMQAPDSVEARTFHRKALDLAETYKDLTGVAFAEVVRRVGEGGSPGPADFDRVELLIAKGDSKIQAGQRALMEAQKAFARRYAILLAPENQGNPR
ncbi:MAG: hypothetical protein AAB074_23205 [Planctomycetota bacterium]